MNKNIFINFKHSISIKLKLKRVLIWEETIKEIKKNFLYKIKAINKIFLAVTMIKK